MAPQRACIIGGGFYGVAIALFLRSRKRLGQVQLIEREPQLLAHASFVNQARVHNGYHYPRSFTTAYRSRINFKRFCDQWCEAIDRDFTKIYAIARRNSKVTGSQFRRFCQQIGAPLQPAPRELQQLFNPALIDSVFQVEEVAFDAAALRRWAERALADAGVETRLGEEVVALQPAEGGGIALSSRTPAGGLQVQPWPLVFNCTYSGLGQLRSAGSPGCFQLKHEIAELALVDVPPPLERVGITVMDGPFFSVMPFPALRCHSFSHVRYTPHCHWLDRPGHSPYAALEAYPRDSRIDRMIRDGARYLPLLAQCRPRDALFEVKTVLDKNEADDGRPILFREDPQLSGLYSILGSKIDNIYDILDCINALPELGA
ncbi:MAG: FAD-dependent oxidoreductase [Cyanobacteriota bacterium]|nr:FAD-dependent oxidoreductase [Cyanobacteriota bacterium]